VPVALLSFARPAGGKAASMAGHFMIGSFIHLIGS
jgi:hypothetical protein